MKERMATFTASVTVKFTFNAPTKLEGEKLWSEAEKQAKKRLKGAKVEYKPIDVEVVDKKVHYTSAELKEMDEAWERFIGHTAFQGR